MEDNRSIQFFQHLMSPEKQLRVQAEKDLQILKEKPFSESFPIFMDGINSQDQIICQFSTLILKKTYFDNSEIRDKLKDEDIEKIKSFIASRITFNNQDWITLKRFGEVLAMIYQQSKDNNYFKDIFELFNKNEFLARKLALFIISNLSDLGVINDDLAKNYSNDFIQIFNVTMKDEKDEVKSSSIIAFNKFIVNLKDEQVQESYSKLIDPLLSNILSLFKEKSNIEKEIFDSLIFLIDSYPKFFKNNIDEIIEFVSKISSEKKIEFHIRTSILEIIYSLSHSIPGKIRSNEKFNKVFIPLIFQLLLDIDNKDSLEKWEKLKEEDENDLEFMFYHIKSGLERISIDLGGKYFMDTINNNIQQFLKSKDWVEIHAGLAGLAFISEAEKEIYKKNLKELLQYISQGLIHEHPRVRYMALIFLGNLLTETAPNPQKNYIGNILPALAKLLTNNEKSLRVKSAACLALNNFLAGLILKNKNTENNIQLLKPYINDLINLILNIFEESLNINYEPLQKNTLDCISLLSNIHENNFGEYYPKIMSGLKKLYLNLEAKTQEQKQLKTNCITTIGYLFSGISEEYDKYKQDFIEISTSFVNSLEQLPIEDPQIGAIIEAFINISMGFNFDDFRPIFDKLFTFLSKYISADIGLSVKDAEVDNYVHKQEDEQKGLGSVVFNYGAKSSKITVNTFALQLKIKSLESLNEIALNLVTNFKDYIEKYIELTRQNLTFSYSRKIRKICIKSIYTCINACSNDDERKKVFELIIMHLLSLLDFDIRSGFFKDMKCIIKYIGKSLNLFEYNLNIEQKIINTIFDLLKNVVDKVKEKINTLYNLFNNDKDGIYDANDKSDQNSDIFQLQKTYKYINILYQNFNKLENKDFVKYGSELLKFYSSLWQEEQNFLEENKEKNDEKIKEVHENSIAMCINFFNIFLEYSDETSFRNVALEYFQRMQKMQESENILPYIIEGFGIICERQDNLLFEQNFSNIFDFIKNKTQTNKENIIHDKAVRAFGKFIYYKCDVSNKLSEEDKIKNTIDFLNLLPVTFDLNESDKICEELFDQITDESCRLLLNEKTIEESKNAVKRIIDLNSKENFIENLTKLLKTTLSLGIDFSDLVDK